jgi:hypothetical protein
LLDGAPNITFIHDSELGLGSEVKVNPPIQKPVIPQKIEVGSIAVPMAAQHLPHHPSPVATPTPIPTQTFTNQNYASYEATLYPAGPAVTPSSAASRVVSPPPGIDSAPNPPPPIPMPPNNAMVEPPRQQHVSIGSHPPGFAQVRTVSNADSNLVPLMESFTPSLKHLQHGLRSMDVKMKNIWAIYGGI